jgi:hypothetical protein
MLRALGLVIFILVLAVASMGTAEIFKWVDSEGKTHYGDCPPTECESEKIKLPPGPSEEAVRQARDRLEGLLDHSNKAGTDHNKEVHPQIRDPAKPHAVPNAEDIPCFSRLGAAWGGRIPEDTKEISRTPLSKRDLRRLRMLFRLLEGPSSGTMEEIECLAPEANPPMTTGRFAVRLDGHWKSQETFALEAHLEVIEAPSGGREFFWFLLSPDGLRFRWVPSDKVVLLTPGDDVEILSVKSDALAFYWQRGGRSPRTNVFSLKRAGRAIVFSEFHYVFGRLALKRIWTVEL